MNIYSYNNTFLLFVKQKKNCEQNSQFFFIGKGNLCLVVAAQNVNDLV